jgi:predicted nucleic acid-binding protein
MADKPKIYIDTTCFVDLAKGHIGARTEDGREKDIWHTKKLLEASRNGDVEIYTSTLTIAECQHVGDGSKIPDEVKRLFRSILTSGKVVILIQPEIFVAERARDLRWNDGINLRGADALHVASALEVNCAEFLTNDFEDSDREAKSKIETLGLRVIRPHETSMLPAKYRQEKLPST